MKSGAIEMASFYKEIPIYCSEWIFDISIFIHKRSKSFREIGISVRFASGMSDRQLDDGCLVSLFVDIHLHWFEFWARGKFHRRSFDQESGE